MQNLVEKRECVCVRLRRARCLIWPEERVLSPLFLLGNDQMRNYDKAGYGLALVHCLRFIVTLGRCSVRGVARCISIFQLVLVVVLLVTDAEQKESCD